MRTQPLSHELGDLFAEIDRLADRHREAVEYAAASERMAFLHARMDALYQALRELRAAGDLLRTVRGDRSGEALWRQTCNELRARAPAAFLAPGRALVTGDLDLLGLVDYTGASIALATERRDRLVKEIAQGLEMRRQRAVAMRETQPAEAGEILRSVYQAIAQIVEASEALQVDAMARGLGWVE